MEGGELVPIEPGSLPAHGPTQGNAAGLIDAWLGDKKPQTIEGYRKDLDLFIRFIGPPGLDGFLALPAGDANALVLSYRNDQIGRGLASATIARRLAAVKSVVKLARTLGRCAFAIEVSPPKAEPRRDMRGPREEAIRRIKKALIRASKRDRALFALLFGLGLRRAEAAGLDLADVDFASNKVHVLGKGRREKVALELPPQLARPVGEWVLMRGGHPGPLFPGKDPSKPINLATVNNVIGRLGKAAGMADKLRPHGLRHAAITLLFDRKATVAEVMAFSRHSKPETVMRYHDSLSDRAADMARIVAKQLD